MMHQLNLPQPSSNLLSRIKILSEDYVIKNGSKSWFDKTQDNKINCAAGDFFRDKIVDDLGESEYFSYFDDPFMSSIGILQNTHPELGIAHVPPHIDRERPLAILFVIEQGGENTLTSFYETPHELYTPEKTVMVKYTDFTKQKSIRTNKNSWYLLDVRRYHSVDNIENKRILFSLNFKISLEIFEKKYKNLFLD